MSCPDCATAFDQGYRMGERDYSDLLAAAEGLEWSVWNQTLVKMQCPTCFGLEPTHHDTCALDAAIKKAKGQ